jgi:hypothetical protein
LTRAFPSEGDDGLVVLRADPDCTEPYSGRFRQATVFIVGYDTDDEQIFTRGQRTEALQLARTRNLTFDQVVARSCCHHLMESLLGS